MVRGTEIREVEAGADRKQGELLTFCWEEVLP